MTRPWLLAVYTAGVLCWMVAVVFTGLGIGLPLTIGGSRARSLMMLAALAALVSGFELTRRWKTDRPRLVVVHLVSAFAILLITGSIIAFEPFASAGRRLFRLGLLFSVFLLAATFGSRPVQAPGRHRQAGTPRTGRSPG